MYNKLLPTLFLTVFLAFTLIMVRVGLPTLVNLAQWAPTQQQKQEKDFVSKSGFVDIVPSTGESVYMLGETIDMDVTISMFDDHVSGFTVPISYYFLIF